MVGNKDIYDAAADLIRDRKYGFYLYYVDYRDGFTTEQVEQIIDEQRIDTVVEEVVEAFDEGVYMAARDYVEEFAGDAIRDLLLDLEDDQDEDDLLTEFMDSDLSDELRYLIEDRDESDPIGDLARHTSDPLVQYVPYPRVEIDVEDEEESNSEAARVLTELGLPSTAHNYEAMYWAMANCHGPTEVRVLFTADMEEMVDLAVDEVRLKNPALLLLNPYDGSGMDTDNMEGTITVPRDQIRLDSALGYGSWDNIAGVVVSAYTVDAEYVRVCRYTFDGTDTDGTDFYRCMDHGSLEPSPDAHCAKAEEPAYGVLIKEGEKA